MSLESNKDRDLIAILEDSLSELLDLGGGKEFTKIQPNAEVINASPTDLPSGYIIIKNYDGFRQPAVTIPGVTFSNGDFANVIYIKGTEPIAFQAGSSSSVGGINAEYIQSRYVAPDAPANGDVLVWSSDSNYWYPDAQSGGGGWPYTTKVITVDASGNADYTTITAAIAAANTGDIIEVGSDLTEDIIVNKEVTIRGVSRGNTYGAAGSAISRGVTITGTGVESFVFQIDNGINSCTIEKLGVQSAYTGTSNSYAIDGNGISGFATLIDLDVIQNTAALNQTAIFLTSGQIVDCFAYTEGGTARYTVYASPTSGKRVEIIGGKIWAYPGIGVEYDLTVTGFGRVTIQGTRLETNTILTPGSVFDFRGQWVDGNGVERYASDWTPNAGDILWWHDSLEYWYPAPAPTGGGGSGANVWPIADRANIDTTEYTTIANLISALLANQQGIIGEGDFPCNGQTIAVASSLLGSGIDETVLQTSTAGQVLNITTALVKVFDMTLSNTYTGGNSFGVNITGGSIYAQSVKFKATGATPNNNYAAFLSAGGSTHVFRECEFDAQNGSADLALYMDDGDTADCYVPIVTGDITNTNGTINLHQPYMTGDITSSGASAIINIYGGIITGDLTQASSGTINLHGIPTITGTLTGTIVGWYRDSNGSIIRAGGTALLDLNGLADGLVLDTDGDTTLSAPTDDQIDFEVGGADRATLTSSGLALAAGARVNEFSTDTLFTGNSNVAVPTEAATRAYVNTRDTAFVYRSVAQSIGTGGFVEIVFNAEYYDTGGRHNTGTGRYTAGIAGYYLVTVMTGCTNMGAGTYVLPAIGLNGAIYAGGQYLIPLAGGTAIGAASAILYMNGSTNYVSGWVYQTDVVARNTLTAYRCCMSVVLVQRV